VSGDSRSDGPGAIANRDARLLEIVGERLAEAARRAGPHLACRLGCTECCVGPFAINALDADRLRRGLALLPPERAEAVRARARAAWSVTESDWARDDDETFYRKHAEVPCPALDPASGACGLYEHRPLPCRTYGPSVRIGGEDLTPCRLCFTTATPAEIENARVEIDTGGCEEELLDALADHEDTVIALVLAKS
jgi:Fe-S-cluster containining protein